MRATEVNLGDWIEFPDGVRARIAALPFVNKYGICAQRIENGELSGVYPIVDCKPIPITDEILIANGYHYDELDHNWYGGPIYSLYGTSAPFSFFDGQEAEYVHELQRAFKCAKKEDEIVLSNA